MKNRFKLIGIIALLAVIGFSMAACSDNSGSGDVNLVGTVWKWEGAQQGVQVTVTLTFTASTVQMVQAIQGYPSDTFNGTYTISGKSGTGTIGGQPFTFEVNGNKLTGVYGGVTYEFTKQQ